MARTTADLVNEILDTELTDTVIDAFIAVANSLVTEKLGTSSLGDTRLIQIETWLTAHLIASTLERMPETETLGDASIKYIGKYWKGLEATPYGQNVLLLDTTGLLGLLGKKAVSIIAIESFDS